MLKYKVTQHDSQTVVKVKTSKNEELITREVNNLMQSPLRGLFSLKYKKGGLFYHYILEYTAPHSIPIVQYLKTPINQKTFYNIMAQIVALINGLQQKNMSLNNLMLDMRYVFVNPNTRELNFLYIPVLSGQSFTDVLGFIRGLLQTACPDANENTKYYSDFLSFCSQQERFSVEAFKNYLTRQDKGAAVLLKNLMVGQSGFMTNKRYEYENHYQSCGSGYQGTQQPKRYGFEEGTTLLDENEIFADYEERETSLLEEENTTLLAEEEQTTFLDESVEWNHAQQYQQRHYPYLIRVSSSERIEIDKPVFRLGKERQYVDYFVTNNNAVSRSHANIITRSNRYFVVDLNTTNYTYINGQIIPANAEVEIFDRNILKLANEEFEFHIQ